MTLRLQVRCSSVKRRAKQHDIWFQHNKNSVSGAALRSLWSSPLQCWQSARSSLTAVTGYFLPSFVIRPRDERKRTYGGHAVIKGWRFSEFWSGNGLSHVFTVAKSYRRYGKRFMGVLSCCVIRRAVQGTLAILVSSRYGALTEQNITALNLDDDFTIFTVNMKACWG